MKQTLQHHSPFTEGGSMNTHYELTHYPDGRRTLTDGQHTVIATPEASFLLTDADLLAEFVWRYDQGQDARTL